MMLRHPSPIPPRFVSFTGRYHQTPRLFVSPSEFLGVKHSKSRDVLGFPLVIHKPVRSDGGLRASQVPGDTSCAFALLFDPGRAEQALPFSAARCCPPTSRRERPRRFIHYFGTQFHGFNARCQRFPVRFPYAGMTRFRLAALPLPGGI